ncbi:hypothetical protein BOTBODRAFT_321533 [Botryobasidium botryosum FD-172 SS1]|uniref:Uncharacterized protein n=1 Tax=Botryobasidium botryosum (strain FD-172 SS1) TaxID=930990 RepID=A0A067MYT0_BOTB1|nr:hypothetical protein BOTBODRAFT_321533 [Botryobasidium botryosum FD-172 SS1]
MVRDHHDRTQMAPYLRLTCTCAVVASSGRANHAIQLPVSHHHQLLSMMHLSSGQFASGSESASRRHGAPREDLGSTPLHFAAAYGRTDELQRLLRSGADPRATDHAGATPLHWAAKATCAAAQREETIWLLTTGNADIDARDGLGDTALHWAVRTGSAVGVQTLVRAGANVRLQNDDEEYALHRVSEIEHPKPGGEIVVTTDEETDKEAAVCLIVGALCSGGADVDARQLKSRTALHEAAERRAVFAVGALLNAGADVHARASDGCTPLHYAVRGIGWYNPPSEMPDKAIASQRASRQICQMLVEAGANPDALDGTGRTPLSYATSPGDLEGVLHVR